MEARYLARAEVAIASTAKTKIASWMNLAGAWNPAFDFWGKCILASPSCCLQRTTQFELDSPHMDRGRITAENCYCHQPFMKGARLSLDTRIPTTLN